VVESILIITDFHINSFPTFTLRHTGLTHHF